MSKWRERHEPQPTYLLHLRELVPCVMRSLSGHSADSHIARPRKVFLVFQDDKIGFVLVDNVRLVV